ncbi:hypothetical protein SLS62_010901 [Diatrype stigma]|uniref:ferric-chelate reductase (NADPH) n=1 Tax=Diatrype stigma TaxID=117547 RepID=A0AAN9U958_9PEZI
MTEARAESTLSIRWGDEGPQEDWLVARQAISEAAVKRYAAGLSALIGLFIVMHWARVGAAKSSWTRIPALKPFVLLSRMVRRVFIRGMFGFTSVGHAALVLAYVALNIGFQVYGVDLSSAHNWAPRFGWMAASNFVFVVFLSLKNTPLAFLTAYSYERLNCLHQIAGYTAFLQAFLHGTIYLVFFTRSGKTELLHEEIVLAAYPLMAALILTVLAAMILRRFNYESFYIIHVVLFIVIVVCLGLHRPHIDPERILICTLIMASLWVSDRLIRTGRLVYNSVNNTATVYPLPNGGTRVVFKKSLHRARPGKHCYVWIPQIRAFETHPFTIASTNPLELVINTYSGFTKDLHNFANAKPGATLKASLEGPYGTNPDPMDYDKVVLVAGGSGATFTFGIAADMLGRMNEESKQRIDFIWSVRKHGASSRDMYNLSWFTQHLNHIRSHDHAPKVALKVHLTSMSGPSSVDGASTSGAGNESDRSRDSPLSSPPKTACEHTDTGVRPSSPPKATPPASLLPTDREKYAGMSDSEQSSSAAASVRDLPLVYGRPDTEALIREAVRSVPKDQRILIAACGPTSLIEVVRNTTASCIRADGPAVELHCEQFGW